MGVAISELIPTKEISLNDLAGKAIAIDAHLFLYQFLSTIRQRDGTPLMDSQGRTTSHLSGLFSRTAKMLELGIKPIYVFDGKAPDLKRQEQLRRQNVKEDAKERYNEAKDMEDFEAMAKYAKRTSVLTKDMIAEAKELLYALGVPVVEAPSEGEAQASHLVSRGDAYAVASSDADALMFGAAKVIKNLAVSGRRKRTKALAYDIIRPEMIEPDNVMNTLGIDRDQFIVLCMLVGTDYNPGGIKGIGPKNALKKVKEYGKEYDRLFTDTGWNNHFEFPWTDVFYIIKKMPVTDDYIVDFRPVDIDMAIEILVGRHDFSRDRIEQQLKKLKEQKQQKQQKGLGDFFR